MDRDFSGSENLPENSFNPQVTTITIIIPTGAYFLSGLRDFTLSLTQNMTGFSEQWAYRFQSVVDELCNNAIEHGSSKHENIKIVFRSKSRDYIEVSVEDSGTGHDKVDAKRMMQLVAERSNPGYLKNVGIRGRGLGQIVASWTDNLKFEDRPGGGLIVTARKYLKHEQDETVNKMNQKNQKTLSPPGY